MPVCVNFLSQMCEVRLPYFRDHFSPESAHPKRLIRAMQRHLPSASKAKLNSNANSLHVVFLETWRYARRIDACASASENHPHFPFIGASRRPAWMASLGALLFQLQPHAGFLTGSRPTCQFCQFPSLGLP
jgi:hypothetical protein